MLSSILALVPEALKYLGALYACASVVANVLPQGKVRSVLMTVCADVKGLLAALKSV